MCVLVCVRTVGVYSCVLIVGVCVLLVCAYCWCVRTVGVCVLLVCAYSMCAYCWCIQLCAYCWCVPESV